MFHVEDTIAAVASATGHGAIGIIRVTGPDLMRCLERCVVAQGDWQRLRGPSVFSAEVHDASGALRVPCEIYLWPDGRSFTRQPLAELHLVNSPPLMDRVLKILWDHGARLAVPGEFTQRAFLAGRIDLAQAEAVLGVIDARSKRELGVALTQLAGGLSQPVSHLRGMLLDLLADLEAGLDFVDDDIEFVSQAEVTRRLDNARLTLNGMVASLETRSVGDRPWQCVLVGEPNAGKSSLFNAVCRQSAIVSERAGTTRDYVVGRLVLPTPQEVQILDTAGLTSDAEQTDSELTQKGQCVTEQMLAQADLVVVCIDGSQPLTAATKEILTTCQAVPHVVAITKSDLPRLLESDTLEAHEQVVVSSVRREGLDALRSLIAARLLEQTFAESAVLRATSQRCHASFRSALNGIERAILLPQRQEGDELVAAELRAVLDDLGQIAGTVCSDDILDRVFSRFCIGK